MDNLHAPTVPSGPTSARVANGNAAQLSIAELQRKKDSIEAELRALGGVLESVRAALTSRAGCQADPLTRGCSTALT